MAVALITSVSRGQKYKYELDQIADKETLFKSILLNKTGNYYFQDSTLGVEISIRLDTLQARVLIPIDMNTTINYKARYGDAQLTDKLGVIICRRQKERW